MNVTGKRGSVARQLAEFASLTRFADLPPQAQKYGAMLVASTLASAALGSTIASARIVRELEVERGGRPEASLWFGTPARLPAVAAARVNAMASDAAASDDSDLRNIVHSGTTACACALAVAEQRGSRGQDVLAAIVLGYEVAGRINTAMIGGLQSKGHHGSIVACFAGAVAAARLMNLDVDGMTRTIALAATSMGALHVAGKASVAREYHGANAAMMAMHAAQACEKGYQPEEHILEMERGFFETYGNRPDVEAVTRDFGTHWNILAELGFKMVPGGTPFHAIAEAAAQAAIAGDVQPQDVACIMVSTRYPYGGEQFPTDLVGIAHSPAYFAAAGVADRDFTWAHAFEQKINDPRIRGLLGKVKVGPAPGVQPEQFKSGAVVTIETLAGGRWTGTVLAPRGAAMLGVQWPEMEAKARALLPFGQVVPEGIDAFLGEVRRLAESDSVSLLLQTLRPRQ